MADFRSLNKMSSSLFPFSKEEVLEHLMELVREGYPGTCLWYAFGLLCLFQGYLEISDVQLEEFLLDLRRLIRYEEKQERIREQVGVVRDKEKGKGQERKGETIKTLDTFALDHLLPLQRVVL